MNRIYGNKILQFGELNSEEVKEVMDEEAQLQQGMAQVDPTGQPMAQSGIPPDGQNAPPQDVLPPIDPLALTPQIQPNV